MAAPKPVTPDSVELQANFSKGMVRDTMRYAIPDGYVYDSVDWMLEQPGRVYKRGGWVNHSAALPAPPSCVGTIHIPTRVVAIVNNDLYDVTSENSPQADLIGSVGFSPGENLTYAPDELGGRLIVCDGNGINRPKKIYTTGAAGTVTLAALGGTPPYAAHSAAYASRVVLARGQDSTPTAGDPNQKNRIWFSNYPDDESTWDTTNKWIEATYEVTGLAAIQGMLLVFSTRFMERIINGVPPGEEGENMELQPVGGVGCIDARSIMVIDNQVIFGSEEGIFLTNGVGFDNLMVGSGSTGILSLWRSLFVEGEVRGVRCGLLDRDYLFVSSSSTDGSKQDFLCYLPSRSWWQLSNCNANMFAPGATEQETSELYAAMSVSNYVAKFSPLLTPGWSNRNDGNGVAVEPELRTRAYGPGPGIKAYGFGRLSYVLDIDGAVGASQWQSAHAYALGALVFEGGRIWRVSTAGTSGAVEPSWVGATVNDGTVIWTNDGPELLITQTPGIRASLEQQLVDVPLLSTYPEQASKRARVRLFKDTQALHLRIYQSGASLATELYMLEVEYRDYPLAADGQ